MSTEAKYEDRHERAADELIGDLLADLSVERANGIHQRLAAGLAALEQACAVPAPAVVTPEPTGGGKAESPSFGIETWRGPLGLVRLVLRGREHVGYRSLGPMQHMPRAEFERVFNKCESPTIEELKAQSAEAGKAQAEGWIEGNGIAVGLGNGQAAWLRVDTGYGVITQIDRYNAYSNEWELTPRHGIVAYLPIDKPAPPTSGGNK